MSQEEHHSKKCCITGALIKSKNTELHPVRNVLSLQDFCAMWPGQACRQARSACREEGRLAWGPDSVGQCWQAAPADMLPFPMDPTGVGSLSISQVWNLIQMPQVFNNCCLQGFEIWHLVDKKVSPSSFSDSNIITTMFCSPRHRYFNSIGNY